MSARYMLLHRPTANVVGEASSYSEARTLAEQWDDIDIVSYWEASHTTAPVTGSVLDEAAGIVHGARQEAYGHPRDNHACTAQLWTAYLRRCGVLKDDAEITPRQVCIANALQKCSRDAHEEKRDNLVDLAGWAANAEMVDE